MAQSSKSSRAPGGSRGCRPRRGQGRDDHHLKTSVDNFGLFTILMFVMPYGNDPSLRIRRIICVTFMLFSDSVKFGFTWFCMS